MAETDEPDILPGATVSHPIAETDEPDGLPGAPASHPDGYASPDGEDVPVPAGESSEIRVPDEERDGDSERIDDATQSGAFDEDREREALRRQGLSGEEIERRIEEMREQHDAQSAVGEQGRFVAHVLRGNRGLTQTLRAQPQRTRFGQEVSFQRDPSQMPPQGAQGTVQVSQGVGDAGTGVNAVASGIGALIGTVGVATGAALCAPVTVARAAAAVIRQQRAQQQARGPQVNVELRAVTRPARQDGVTGAWKEAASTQPPAVPENPGLTSAATPGDVYRSPLVPSSSGDALGRASENVENMARMNRAYASLADENLRYEGRFRSRLAGFAASQGMSMEEALSEMRTGGRAEHLLGEYSDMVDASPDLAINRKIQDQILSGFADNDVSFSEQRLAPIAMNPEDRKHYLSVEQRRNDEVSSIMERSSSRLPVRSGQDNPADAFDRISPLSVEEARSIRSATRYDGEHPEVFEAIREAKLQQIEYQESALALNMARTPEEAQRARERADRALAQWIPQHESVMKKIAEEEGRGHGTEALDELKRYQEKGAESMQAMAGQIPGKEGEQSHAERLKAMMERIRKAVENIMNLLRGRFSDHDESPSPQ